ncbi:MAG: molybdopterin-synthase adenylyltransferase MoeB [Gaiellaceae bacterium]
MAGYRELLQQVKGEIDEVDADTASELIGQTEPPLVVDVREQEEWDEGHLPGAVHIPRGHLESRIERLAPDRGRPIILYCAAGNRSAFAAKTLQELGYERVASLAGGYTDWKRNGFATQTSEALTPEQRRRYSRHLLIPEVDEAGQLRLLSSRVLLIGAGGLGSPASLYLAAAGVGTLGIVDEDVVDESNLQRQILHSTARLGRAKVDSARETIEALNPEVAVKTYEERLSSENIDRILSEGWDVILQGADNFPTRYLVNDASVFHRIPVVDGSIFRFEGHVTVFKPFAGVARDARDQGSAGVTPSPSEMTGRHTNGAVGGIERGPCYRCLFPEPPPPELAPSCAEGGVLGVLPGIIGALQANEVLKLLLGIGEPLIGRLLQFDALAGEFLELRVRRNEDCPVCGEHPTISEYIDYVQFCQAPSTPGVVS